ncbi:hypothetical protein DM02DRAFT_636563 [Periconia macrospinosa]|uniref:Uncharacterized protein n=1 Tax=Periconia macrospinosa TaxID=97972 RepID=A0A2V1CYH8_9PLEO|nr:hypothetical protein DM02DRAFT_636563 [Periconia macrospinosa]
MIFRALVSRTLPLQTQEKYTGELCHSHPERLGKLLDDDERRQTLQHTLKSFETEAIERREKREKEEARETTKAEQRAKVEARKQAPADARALKLSRLGNKKASTPRPLKKKPNTRCRRVAQALK